jgi:virulence factor Mce-like protein
MINKRYVALGLAVIVIMSAFAVYVVGGLSGRVSNDFPVTVTFDHVGQLLRVTGDVKLRGVLIGKIARIDHLRDGTARVTLALDKELRIPADVNASVRGKTLFGEKYVALIDPTHPTGEVMKSGAVIPQSRTVPAFELEQVLQSLLPVLDATEPGDLGGSLHALAEGLAGNEEAAKRAIDNSLIVLRSIGANRADLDRLLAGADEGTDALKRASPDLAAALNELDAVANELVAHSPDLKSLLHDTPSWLDVLAAVVKARYRDLVDLSVKGANILDLVSAHRTELPSTVSGLKLFTQDWNTNLSTPCEDANGDTVAEKHPELAGSTCWQVWIVAGEKEKDPGGYDSSTEPQPGPAAADVAYRAQLKTLLDLPFGTEPTGLQTFLLTPLRDAKGLIPEGLL